MKLPNKEEVKMCVQFGLVLHACVYGFWFSFLLVWFTVGLPQEWWALLVTAVLGILSSGGLFTWITRG